MPHFSELKTALLQEGYNFSYFQAIRLLGLLSRASDRSLPDPWIRTRPKLSLAFPPADIDRIEALDEPDATSGYCITANFLGLYGSASPLPTFYTEDLMDEAAADETVARDFIDFINQRLFDLFLECCRKYRQTLQVAEEGSGSHAERLFCLLGLGDKPLRDAVPDPWQLLRYIGLLTQRPRSAMGLETLLQDGLNGMPVRIIPCVERAAKIPTDQRLRLGGGQALGGDTVLGSEIADRMGNFEIRIGPLDSAGFQSFYPGAENYERTRFLTDLYILDRLEYDLAIILAEGEARTVSLGDPERARLGLNTWVFSSPRIGEVRKCYSPRRTGG